MNIDKLILDSQMKYPDNEKLFFASFAINLLDQTSNFSLLETRLNLKKNLDKILGEKQKSQTFLNSFAKKGEFLPRGKLELLIALHQQILSSSSIDEYVLLLSSLKALDDLGVDISYRTILKEVLMKNLHKIENLDFPFPFIGRKKELEEIKRNLGRSFRNNVLIVGSTGIGKTTLAQIMKSQFKELKIFQLFSGNNIFFDQIVSLLADSSGKKVLFFLDELFTFDPGQIKYAIDNAQVIGTANDVSFRKFAQENPGIISKFEVVRLEEPTTDETKQILSTHQHRLSEKNQISWEDGFSDELIILAKQYLSDQAFPAKGISLLEESALYAKTQNTSKVLKDMLSTIISQKTNIPIASMGDFDKQDLFALPEKLELRVKGQRQAVEKVSKVIQRSKLGLGRKNRPIGSFLFVGPSGVGKTELAKAVAEQIFGSSESMVRIDMSEYSEAHNVQRLIGAPPGYIGFEEGGQLTNPIKAKPYNLILLDEVEKAHPRIFDIFLQVLDDGRLTDGQGKVVDFKNTIIIATSNAGIEDILDLINEGKTQLEIEKEMKAILEDYFRVEFINRFDEIIIFNSLEPEALKKIAVLQINKLKTELAKRHIGFSVADKTVEYLAKESFDPRYGARGLIRVIQERIENKLAEMIISNQLKEGHRVEF